MTCNGEVDRKKVHKLLMEVGGVEDEVFAERLAKQKEFERKDEDRDRDVKNKKATKTLEGLRMNGCRSDVDRFVAFSSFSFCFIFFPFSFLCFFVSLIDPFFFRETLEALSIISDFKEKKKSTPVLLSNHYGFLSLPPSFLLPPPFLPPFS